MPPAEAKKARYADALKSLEAAVLKIAEVRRPNRSVDETVAALHLAMDDLSSAMHTATAVKCRSCIKTITPQEAGIPLPPSVRLTHQSARPQAETLCRNSDYTGMEMPHEIERNTGFRLFLREPKQRWFFGNDLLRLAASGQYDNTTEDWQDRYHATLIWPIFGQLSTSRPAPLIGYLCVDSLRSRPFNRELDFPLGAIVAHTVAPVVSHILAYNII